MCYRQTVQPDVVIQWVYSGDFEPIRKILRAPEAVSAGIWLDVVRHVEGYNGFNGAQWAIQLHDFVRRNHAALLGHMLLIELVDGVLRALRSAWARQLDFVGAFQWILGGDIVVAFAGASVLGAAIPIGLCALVGFVTTRSNSRNLQNGIVAAEKILEMLEHKL